MWDWTTSILKAQVSGRRGLRVRSVVPALPLSTSQTLLCQSSPSLQHDDEQPVVLRRRSSSDLARQKFGTMPLLPIRGDDSGATLLSANQTLVRSPRLPQPSWSLPVPLPHCRREWCACQPGAPLCLLCAPTPHPWLLLPGLTVSLCFSSPHPHPTSA